MDIKKRIDFLKDEIKKHNINYYVNDEPLIDDSEYDKLMNELILLETNFPEYKDKNSPTQNVGDKILEKFTKVEHVKKMLSLGNAFNFDDLKKFDNQIKKIISNNFSYYVEPKIDGLSISLIYSNGKLIRGVTRGDGFIGEDVTFNIKTIKSIPHKIKNDDDYFEVRGEIFLSKDEFSKINHERLKNNEKLFANPRNAASGSIRQLDSLIAKSRNLDCWLYYYYGDQKFKLHSETIEFISKLGFKTIPISRKAKNINDVKKIINEYNNIRNELDYEIDGIVIKLDELNYYDEVGYTSKIPKWAIAYKFPAEIKKTKLLDIIPTLGRTGRITYNAALKPVEIAGTIVKSAILHNSDWIIGKDIRIGSIVKIKKAGDIIPEVIESLIDDEFLNLKKFSPITNCPFCDSKLIRNEIEIDQYCLNKDCIGKKLRSIEHFTSRNAMNIEGLSEKIILKLFDNKFINDFADLYDLKKNVEKIISLDKIGKKLMLNLLNSIEKTKNNSSEKLLFALGIRYIGKKTADILLNKFNDIENLFASKYDEIIDINEIGPKAAESIVNWYKEKENKELLTKLKKFNLNFKYYKNNNLFYNEKISEKNFVITGTLTKPRSYYIDIIEKNKGAVLSSITKNVDFVLFGENPGNKYNKAIELNIKFINETDFKKMIEENDDEKNW